MAPDTSPDSARHFVLALDSSKAAHRAAKWAVDHLVRPGDTVHVLVVTSDGQFGSSMAPIASVGANKREGLEAMANTQAVHAVLHLASGEVAQEQFQVSVVRAPVGARGVARSVVAFAAKHSAALVVLGTRGLDGMSSSLMSLVGLGSVSELVVRDAPCPVALVRGTAASAHSGGAQQVLLLVEAHMPRQALQWALGNVVRPADHLHMLCMGQPTAKLSAIAGEVLPQGQIHVQGLPPSAAPAELCQGVCNYCQDNGIQLALLSRQPEGGLGAVLRRALGRGGLDQELSRRLECPLIVLKDG